LRYKFPCTNRLAKKTDFEGVFNNPQKITQDSFLALYTANGLTQARLGIMISKKRVENLVMRNLIKRLIRESFRQSNLQGWDVIVMLRATCSMVNKKTMRESADKLWPLLVK